MSSSKRIKNLNNNLAKALRPISAPSKVTPPDPPPRRAMSQSQLDKMLSPYRSLDVAPEHSELIPEVQPKSPTTLPIGKPDTLPATLPISKPDTLPTGKPATLLIGKPDTLPINQSTASSKAKDAEKFTPLDATHSTSEAAIYSIMYRLTISKGIKERNFRPGELIELTSINSRTTVLKAISGLLEKLSVEIIEHTGSHPIGHLYRIYEPSEIERRRRVAGMIINPQTKRVVKRNDTQNLSSPKNASLTSSLTSDLTKNWSGALPETALPALPNFGKAIFNKENKENLAIRISDALSLSNTFARESDDDDVSYYERLQSIYEIATGNDWTIQDTLTAQKGREFTPEVWGIAICHCIDRAPNHQFGQLAYCLAQTRETADQMAGAYTPEELRGILKHYLARLARARAAGVWKLAEIEATENTPLEAP